MRILVIHPRYGDAAGPAATIRAVAAHMAARGHRVTALTVRRKGDEEDRAGAPLRDFRAGVRIIRTRLGGVRDGQPLRTLTAARFLAFAFAYAARHRFDVLWTTAEPAVAGGIAGRLASRGCGARLLYHIHTVQPEAASGAGPQRHATRLAAWLDSQTCRAAAAVVVHGDEAIETIGNRGGNGAVAFHMLDGEIPAEEDARLASLARWREVIESLGTE